MLKFGFSRKSGPDILNADTSKEIEPISFDAAKHYKVIFVLKGVRFG